MDEPCNVYYVKIPLIGCTPEQLIGRTGYFTVARAVTPEGAAEVVRALLSNPAIEWDHVAVEVRREI